MNKEYILNIINKIDYPGNSDLTEKIESINFSEQDIKINFTRMVTATSPQQS